MVQRMDDRFYEREYRPGDEWAVLEVETQCFRDAWPLSFFVSETAAEGRYHRILLEADREELAAYLLCVWQYLDLHVLNLGVRPRYRRRGLARRLLRGAENELVRRGGESMILEVRESNTGARGLYHSLDYEEIGCRPGYYSDGEDAVVMQKRAEKWVRDAATR